MKFCLVIVMSYKFAMALFLVLYSHKSGESNIMAYSLSVSKIFQYDDSMKSKVADYN